jgi:hypothetical protein
MELSIPALLKVEVQLTKLQIIIACVLNFSLPVGDIISLAALKDALLLNKWYNVTLHPLDELRIHTFVTFFQDKAVPFNHTLINNLFYYQASNITAQSAKWRSKFPSWGFIVLVSGL